MVSGVPEDLSPQKIATLSSLEMWREDAASKMLGMVVLECSPGTARVSMHVRGDMVNGWGLCHGGLIASLADSAFAVACNSYGTVTVASGFEINFIQSGRRGDELIAHAVERARGNRSGLFDVTVTRASDGETIAEFRGRSHQTNRTNPALEQ